MDVDESLRCPLGRRDRASRYRPTTSSRSSMLPFCLSRVSAPMARLSRDDAGSGFDRKKRQSFTVQAEANTGPRRDVVQPARASVSNKECKLPEGSFKRSKTTRTRRRLYVHGPHASKHVMRMLCHICVTPPRRSLLVVVRPHRLFHRDSLLQKGIRWGPIGTAPRMPITCPTPGVTA